MNERAGESEQKALMVPEKGRGLAVLSRFVETKGHALFVDMCEFCRDAGVVGICEGPVGIGKTGAARRYSQWDLVEPRLSRHGVRQSCLSLPVVMPRVGFYRVGAMTTPKRMEQDVGLLRWDLQRLCEAAGNAAIAEVIESGYIHPGEVDLLIVDEANRLCKLGFEVLRDVVDEGKMGLVLLGHAGLRQKVLAQPALASRVGVRYVFEGLSEQEVRQLLQEYVQERELEMKEEVAGMLVEKTQGNIQTVRLVLKQIEYLLQINRLSVLSRGVVEVACSQLLRQG